MPLVEIIKARSFGRGPARVFDYTWAIGISIVVNDSRLPLRVIGTLVNEALRCLVVRCRAGFTEQWSQAGIRRRCSCPTSSTWS